MKVRAVCVAQVRGYFDSQGKSKSAKGVGGAEPGAKQAAYASGAGGTAGRKESQERFFFGWLIWLFCFAMLFMSTVVLTVIAYMDEDRYIAIGMVGDLLFVVFTECGENIRLISARLATEKERRLYYDQSFYN